MISYRYVFRSFHWGSGAALNYTTAPGVLILHPSIPAIAPLNQGQLTRPLSGPSAAFACRSRACVTFLTEVF